MMQFEHLTAWTAGVSPAWFQDKLFPSQGRRRRLRSQWKAHPWSENVIPTRR